MVPFESVNSMLDAQLLLFMVSKTSVTTIIWSLGAVMVVLVAFEMTPPTVNRGLLPMDTLGEYDVAWAEFNRVPVAYINVAALKRRLDMPYRILVFMNAPCIE